MRKGAKYFPVNFGNKKVGRESRDAAVTISREEDEHRYKQVSNKMQIVQIIIFFQEIFGAFWGIWGKKKGLTELFFFLKIIL